MTAPNAGSAPHEALDNGGGPNASLAKVVPMRGWGGRTAAALLAATLALGLGGAASASEPDDSIEDFIDAEMPSSGVPGVAYAVVANGEVTSVGARGVVKLGSDTDVTPDTPFVIGSISKSFTALAVMQLVEAGKVDLDAEVSQYLDVFRGQSTGAITIRQLLSHTSGFSTMQGNASQPNDTDGMGELAGRVEGLAQEDLAHQPGERWEYSNANYQILGRLIEVISAQDYQAYVTTNILEPVGMEHSFVADGEVHESMAIGHTPWFFTKRPRSENATDRGTAPQGGIIASANDLALYMQMMMNGEDDVLSAEGKALMMRPANAASPDYGFGWSVEGNGSVWHAGVSPGFESLATLFPGEKSGVVVMVNGGSGLGFGETSQLREGITATALGRDYVGDDSRRLQKGLFLALMLLPIVYLLSMLWAWRHRTEVRAKASNGFGRFSLLFPVLTTLAAAWVFLFLVPSLAGAPLSAILLFAPDLGLLLVAAAVTGVLWAVFRLVVAYTGRSSPA